MRREEKNNITVDVSSTMTKLEENRTDAKRLLERLVIRFHRADKFWLFWSVATIFVAVLVPSGILGIILFLAAREYLRWAEDV